MSISDGLSGKDSTLHRDVPPEMQGGMKHPHAVAIEKLYSDFSKGDAQAVIAACADSMTFQVPGKSKLAGKYTKESFARDFAGRLREFSGGTFKMEVHDVLASDLHATVLGTCKLVRDGKSVELRTVHVWRFENGKPLAGYEYPRDLYMFDLVWG
jgi:ketosteroid isomerase-like protein